MQTPLFFNDVSTISLYDPLSEFLGATQDGTITYTYEDVVKLAGHSCPTVAGAYLMVQKGLNLLYTDETPVRGEIRVLIRGMLGDGVVGVVANIASLITGATDISGFHGLGGKFNRCGLLHYESDILGEIAFERLDIGRRVILSYNPSIVPIQPQMQEWMGEILGGKADSELSKVFKEAWQERVKRILIHYTDHPELITYTIEEFVK